MENTPLATKFPKSDIREMDILIDRGIFISRSDIIRTGARKLIEAENKKLKTDKDVYVKYLADTGTFKDTDLNLIAKLHIELATEPEKAVSKDNFSKTEIRILNRLLRHPLKLIKKTGKGYYLTENGIDTAEGFLEGLLHLKVISVR